MKYLSRFDDFVDLKLLTVYVNLNTMVDWKVLQYRKITSSTKSDYKMLEYSLNSI